MKRLQIGLCAAIAAILVVNVAVRVHHESVLDDAWKAQQLSAHHCEPSPLHPWRRHCTN